MNFVKHLNLFGLEAKEVPCITNSGKPTAKTEGAVGCLYMDTDNGTMYKCVSASEGVLVWEKIEGTSGTPGKDGYTPIRGIDYWTPEDVATMQADNKAYIATELAKRGQLQPEFANSVDECTDTSKLYVLPDGFIYAYMAYEEYPYTNQISLSINADGTQYVGENGEDGYKRGYRLGADGAEKPAAGYAVTGFIPAKSGDVIHLKNVPYAVGGGVNTEYLIIYNSNFEILQPIKATDGFSAISYLISDYTVEEDTGYLTSMTMYDKYESGISYIRFGVDGLDNSAIITINEEITGEPVVTYSWTNTGHAFVPADYEDRIVKAENDIATLKQVISGDLAVYGIVDDENNIVMTGTLTVGKYKLKYMNEDGTTTEIGEFTME